MAAMVQIDVEAIRNQHKQLLEIIDRLDRVVLAPKDSPEREVHDRLREVAEQMLDQAEDILDADLSREGLEEMRLNGTVPLDRVRQDLGL